MQVAKAKIQRRGAVLEGRRASGHPALRMPTKTKRAEGSKRGPKPTLVNPRKVNFWIEMEDFEKLRLLAYWHSSDVATEIRRIVVEHLRKHPPKPISPA